jgi:6-phosphogluconolactonase (cycloisomerase 2 family)
VRLESVLERAVPVQVTDLRLSGFSSSGVKLYGPQTRAKAAVLEFTGVPVSVTRLLIEYLVDDRVVGLLQEDVRLQEGQTLVIEDPDFQDVGAVLTSLEITPSRASIARGTQVPLTVTGRMSDGSVSDLTESVAWSASGSAVSVSEQGIVTGLQVGSTTVTAQLGLLSTSVPVTVTSATVVSLKLAPTTASLPAGLTLTFSATATFSDQTTQDVTEQATFSSSEPAVASIEASGKATARTSGQTIISASFAGKSAQARLEVTSAVLQNLSVSSSLTAMADGTSQQLRASGVFSDGSSRDMTETVTWTSSAPNVVGVNSDGVVTALAPGSAQIRASFSSVNALLALTVTDAVVTGISLTPETPSVAKGVSQTFSVLATFSDQSTQEVTNQSVFASSSPSIASVSTLEAPRGVAATLAAGQTTITASFQGFEADATLTVTPAVLASLEVYPASSLVAPGRQRRLGLLGIFSDGSRQALSSGIVWSTPSGDLSVDSQGLVSVPAQTVLGTVAVITATRDGLSAQAEVGVGRYAFAIGGSGLSGYGLDEAGNISLIETLNSGLPQGELQVSASGRYLYASTLAFGGNFSPQVYEVSNTGQLQAQGTEFFDFDTNLTFHPRGRWAFMDQTGSITTYEIIADGSLVARHSFTDPGVDFGAMAVDPQREVLFVLTPSTRRVRSFTVDSAGVLTPLASLNPQFSNLPVPPTELYADSLRGELFGVRPANSFSAQKIAPDGSLSALNSALSTITSAALGPNSGRFVSFLTIPGNTLRSASSFTRTPSPQFSSVTSLSLGTEVLLDVALSPAEDIIYGLGKTSGTVRSYRFNAGTGNLEATGSSAAAPVATDPLDFSNGALVVTPRADLAE